MYEVYLDGKQLPVTPGKIQIKINGNNKTVKLIDQGEVNVLKTPGLSEVSFDALLPYKKYPFSATGGTIEDWLGHLEALKGGRRPFRLIVTRNDGLYDTNLAVALEEYTIKEDASSQGLDTLVSVKLKQHRPYGTKTVAVTEEGTATTEMKRESTKIAAKSHTVVKGDTLWALCGKYLGNPTRYPEIAALNNIPNPNLIYPGQVIKFS